MAGMPSGTVIASDSELVRYAVQHALHSALFRVLVVMMYTVWSWVVHLKYLCGCNGNWRCLQDW